MDGEIGFHHMDYITHHCIPHDKEISIDALIGWIEYWKIKMEVNL